ncbi:MAG: hypothetical protein M3253_02090 [Chloroflexota bacterium]|nr:hypothetical protein [Chloroflexota bacterium]
MPAISLALALGLLIGCTGGPPAATPLPTTGVPSPDSPRPAPSPTASPSPTPAEGQISHPTGPTDVVLRMEQAGGFVPMGWMVTQAPDFTLYGDGRFIFRPLEDPEVGSDWDSGQPRFIEGRLNEEAVQSLLRFALNNGRLREAREDYGNDMIADASTTVFTINADGLNKTVSVYALAEVSEPGPDALDRQAFSQLVELLRSFEGRARSGELGDAKLYEPTHYRVTLMESFGEPGEAGSEPVDWPWEDITPEDFGPLDQAGTAQRVLSAEEVALLTDMPSGGHPGIAVRAPDDTIWLLAIRPLLPDEPADQGEVLPRGDLTFWSWPGSHQRPARAAASVPSTPVGSSPSSPFSATPSQNSTAARS